MQIQLNADKNLSIDEAFSTYLNDLLSNQLSRYEEQISRLEVHLSDENGGKSGQADKRCLIEARMEGMQPIAVTADAATHEKSVEDAIKKLKNIMDTIIGRLKNY